MDSWSSEPKWDFFPGVPRPEAAATNSTNAQVATALHPRAYLDHELLATGWRASSQQPRTSQVTW